MTLTALRAIDNGVDVPADPTISTDKESYCITKTVSGKKSRAIRGKLAVANGAVEENKDCAASLRGGWYTPTCNAGQTEGCGNLTHPSRDLNRSLARS